LLHVPSFDRCKVDLNLVSRALRVSVVDLKDVSQKVMQDLRMSMKTSSEMMRVNPVVKYQTRMTP
jgi:hypothetical protein